MPFDARLVTATNRDLEAAIEEGSFREDLFFRINVIELPVPPLRARGVDVLVLAQHFLEAAASRSGKSVHGITRQAAEKLMGYAWPGNVRELRNAIERAVTLTDHRELLVDDLPERIRAYRKSDLTIGAGNPAELAPMEEVERRYVLHVLQSVGGNRTHAARILGLDRKTLYRKLRSYQHTTPNRPETQAGESSSVAD